MALPLTSDQPDRTVAPAERTLARNFLVARLGSLLAFVPLGAWTVAHLWHQLAAYESPQAWEIAVTGHVNVATTVLVFVLVLGPLLWHTVWGIARMFRSRPAPLRVTFSLDSPQESRCRTHPRKRSQAESCATSTLYTP